MILEKAYGWKGKILRVNLTDEESSTVPTSDYLPDYVGGRGIAARIYWDEVPPECSAFGPENKLIIMTGPITGSLAPGSARMTMVGKCPQTYPIESYGRSNAGGHWGPELKFAGYDGVILEGKASKPVYISINNQSIELLDASPLWGLNTHEAQEMIRGIHDEKSKTLLIGPAAENQARIAVVSSDSNVAFGQGGFGGVMGSKNLKAIVVRGTEGLEVAHPTYMAELYSQLEFLMKGPKRTMSGDPGERLVGVGGWSDYSKNTKLYEYVIEGKAEWWYDSCFACHICNYDGGASKISIRFNDESIPSGASHCVEYGMYIPPEQLYYGGKMYGKVSAEASHLVDMLGINALEVYFTTRGFEPDPRETREGGRRMDCLGGLNLLYLLYKAGVLNEKNTGLPFSKFGSREFILDLLHKIAYREGFGDLLAEGLPRALHYMMEHPEEFDITEDQIKEIELAYKQGFPRSGGFGGYPRHHFFCGGQGCGYLYHPQVLRCCIDQCDFSTLHTNTRILRLPGIEYASDKYWRITGPVAKKWMGSPKAFDQYTTDYKSEAAYHGMRMAMELDCLPLCDFKFPLWFSRYTPDRLGDDEVGSKLFYAVTGIKKTQEELFEMVDPIWDLERAIACREGRRRKDDWLHDHEFQGMDLEGRYLSEKDLKNLLDQLYTCRGWDINTGIPTKERLEKIGLKDVAQELSEMGFY